MCLFLQHDHVGARRNYPVQFEERVSAEAKNRPPQTGGTITVPWEAMTVITVCVAVT